MTLQEHIDYIDKRLAELRIEYKTASVAKREFIVIGASMLKKDRERYVEELEHKI